MIAEIATRGPIACGICVTPEFEAYAGGIYTDSCNCTTEMHVIAVEGYGEENGTPYWLGRNRYAVWKSHLLLPCVFSVATSCQLGTPVL